MSVFSVKKLEGLKVMPSEKGSLDIFQMLEKNAKKKREERARLLESLEIKEFFDEGSITINQRTCKGVECKLCIKACPTNALYWGYEQVKIIEDLCVYCASCVLSCIVDNCIEITRKRADGKIEKYSTPSAVPKLLENINSKKRFDIVKNLFEDQRNL
jgi:Na+-translocating ferredoxin:NAD+ oxidoreductase RNF subunit RnfB